MKNYEEMARDVLHRMDEYEIERKLRRAKLTRFAASVTPVCAAAVVGVSLWKGGILTPAHEQIISDSVDSMDFSADYIIPENNNNDQYTSDVISTSKAANDKSDDSKVQSNEISAVEFTQNETVTSFSVNQGENVKSASSTGNDTPLNPAEDFPSEVQTNPPIQQQTEPNFVVVDTPSEGNSPSNGWCVFISSIEWNGITYLENYAANVSAYTQGNYIGKVGDFNGEYQDNAGYRISSDDSVYTVKETSDVLLVVKSDGSIIIMSSPDWLAEESEPKDSDTSSVAPDYPEYEDLEVFNGFCQ